MLIISLKLVSAGTNEGVPTTVGIGTSTLRVYFSFDSNNVSSYSNTTSFSSNKQSLSFNSLVGKINGSASFNGINQYLNYSKTVMPTKPWTYSWWGKANDTTTTGYWWGDTQGATATTLVRLQPNIGTLNNGMDGAIKNGGDVIGFTVTIPPVTQNLTRLGLNATNWSFYTVTVNDSGYIRTYINGANEIIGGTINGTAEPFNGLMLGNREDLARDLKGSIDEFQIYYSQLNANNISVLYSDQLVGIRPYSNLSTPTNLGIVSITNQSIMINWTNPTDTYFNHTNIWYNTSTTAMTFFGNTTETSINVTGLTNSTTYNIFLYSSANNYKNTSIGAFASSATNYTISNSCTYSGSGNWNINMADYCILNIPTTVPYPYNLSFYADGNITINTTINTTTLENLTLLDIIWMKSNAILNVNNS
jgi:hypothetical protein